MQIINSFAFINILKWFIDFFDPLLVIVNVEENFSIAESL